jgi:NADH-quinone oxidoreductase subunit L
MYAGPWKAAPARLARAWPWSYQLMVDKFRVDELYQFLVLDPLKWVARVLWRVADVFFIDGVVNGAGQVALAIGRFVRLAQNGDVQRYAAIMAVAAGAIIWTVLGTGGP